MYLTVLSLFRLFMLPKVSSSVLLVVEYLKTRDSKKLIFIENCKSIFFACYKTLFLIHIGACIWIYLRFYGNYSDSTFFMIEKELKKSGQFNFETIDNLIKAMNDDYTNSFYFTTTTMTTIGYGDTNGDNEIEMIYLTTGL